ncbi:hypothetical protein Hamer_G005391 [Homarus americanus]|uniref:Uncharacterized protein n=1 Tax=Homarus americanus TaxID=6706 RepID=A0A8J5MXI4_HOMAM|nr:hypothetical protein Hamer_G005391 [Homarus americanus]
MASLWPRDAATHHLVCLPFDGETNTWMKEEEEEDGKEEEEDGGEEEEDGKEEEEDLEMKGEEEDGKEEEEY